MEDDINYYRAEVRDVSRLTPNMIRIIFEVADPEAFASSWLRRRAAGRGLR